MRKNKCYFSTDLIVYFKNDGVRAVCRQGEIKLRRSEKRCKDT